MGRETSIWDRLQMVPTEPYVRYCIRCNFRHVSHPVDDSTYYNRKKWARHGWGVEYKGHGVICRDRRKCNRNRRRAK